MNDALQQLALDLAAVHPLDLQVAIGRLRFLYGYHYGRIGADESEAEIATEMLVARVIDEADALRQANKGVMQ